MTTLTHDQITGLSVLMGVFIAQMLIVATVDSWGPRIRIALWLMGGLFTFLLLFSWGFYLVRIVHPVVGYP